MVETRLRWCAHVERRPTDSVVRRVNHMEDSQLTKGRGRPRKTIRKTIKKDIEINSWIEIWFMIIHYGLI